MIYSHEISAKSFYSLPLFLPFQTLKKLYVTTALIQKLYIENAGTNNPLQFLHLKYPVVRPPSITTINPAAKIVYVMHLNC